MLFDLLSSAGNAVQQPIAYLPIRICAMQLTSVVHVLPQLTPITQFTLPPVACICVALGGAHKFLTSMTQSCAMRIDAAMRRVRVCCRSGAVGIRKPTKKSTVHITSCAHARVACQTGTMGVSERRCFSRSLRDHGPNCMRCSAFVGCFAIV